VTVRLTINGEPAAMPEGSTLGQVVAAVTSLDAGVAAVINGEVVPRRSWPATPVGDGDRVEVVSAVPGG
jgi:sulfur carrier protein